ncbi:MAG TPA: radical SAM protein [Bacteroidota bacterium]|nr:radical SAM protein [Bacteroidota bacterium]
MGDLSSSSKGETLVVQDGDTLLLYGQRIRKLVRLPGTEINEEQHMLLKQQGFFQELSHVPTTDFCNVWKGYGSLMLLVSRRCNMQCIYCYASAQPDGPMMSVDQALSATDYYLNQWAGSLRVSFHGGGEPTLNHAVLQAVVDRVRERASGRKATFSVVTNGVLSPSRLDWLMENHFNITISWDGPPAVQNRNRPLVGGRASSQHLESTARILGDRGYPFWVRSTISPADDIRETVAYFAKFGVKKIHLEPLFPHGREYDEMRFGSDSTDDVAAPAASELVRLMLDAIAECERHGIKLSNSVIGRDLPKWRGSQFCGSACSRGLLVTHDGSLTSCSEVVDSQDEASPVFHYGTLDAASGLLVTDQQKRGLTAKRHVMNIGRCSACPVKYACGTGCAIKAYRYSGNVLGIDAVNCAYVRQLVPLLIKRAAKNRNI